MRRVKSIPAPWTRNGNARHSPDMDAKSTWIYLRFHLREVAAIAAVVAVIAGFLALTFLPYRSPNFGFGPDWDCSNPGKGESICVKRETPPESPG